MIGSPYRGIVGANDNSPMVINIPPLPNDPYTNGGFGGMTQKKT